MSVDTPARAGVSIDALLAAKSSVQPAVPTGWPIISSLLFP